MAKETLASMLDDFINEQLNQIVLSNPVEKNLLQKVKVRPMLMKGARFFRQKEFTKTQAFHRNMNAEEAKGVSDKTAFPECSNRRKCCLNWAAPRC